jgi:hypothetical protein
MPLAGLCLAAVECICVVTNLAKSSSNITCIRKPRSADHANAYAAVSPCRRFGLAFGESVNGSYGIFGNPSKYGLLHNVGAEPNADLAGTIPLSLFAVFQGAFAIITPALLIGSVADR